MGKVAKSQEIPLMGSSGWSDYCLSLFESDEVDEEGNPYVHGLRRVARLLLGPIVYSDIDVVKPPKVKQDKNGKFFIGITTVIASVGIKWKLELGIGEEPEVVRFSDTADVYYDNTDPKFAKFPSSLAATRAEARCLRKALQLKRVASEELSSAPEPITGLITKSQMQIITNICKRIMVDVEKFAQANGFKSMAEVPGIEATKLMKIASDMQAERVSVPEEIKL